MPTGMDDPVWPQSSHATHVLPHIQTIWLSLQNAQQPLSKHEQQFPPRNDTKDTDNHADYATGSSQDQVATAPALTPLHMLANESQDPALPVQSSRLLTPAEWEHCHQLAVRVDHKPHVRTARCRGKQIATGRWHSDEHDWFLKGLEMFQGPAWGEIAQLIGTRTPTQVRTHAQKFFTKLARLNQTMPYFEVQIEKVRARLVARGNSVTPTASRIALSTTLLSRTHLARTPPSQSLKRFQNVTSWTCEPADLAPHPDELNAIIETQAKWTNRDHVLFMAPARRRAVKQRRVPRAEPSRHVVVMVLGDVGRSPRMQYQALSLARMSSNLRVTLLGYSGERCVPDVLRQRNIHLLPFTPRLQRFPRTLFLLVAPVKVLLQLLQLLWLLLVTVGSVDLVLLQNPPT
ncbi:hypothetical protein PsorP6_001519 [Peronosclerospora sorghi]|uniref:Uncharacterized protein n=1 Tax=Peronosclerospora sorghi TaxID=230839 RepID=A0ACC0WWS8_9STRA|nr:hypothetical protein PsorP6_001519 [Peronosclerospora sorghi]